ncbi:MAG: ribosome biogenesis GTPase Der [Opitutales bacterium]
MNPERSVAIVGRPNVGKSRLFNRLVGRRVAIVHDEAGITRDIVSAEVGEGDFTLMDTGGIGIVPKMTTAEIHAATEEQVDFAIQAAHALLFVVDGMEGLTALDQELTERLRTYHKDVILVVNKIDQDRHEDRISEFHALGFGEPVGVSAEHGRNFDVLDQRLRALLGPKPKAPVDELKSPDATHRIKLCLAGRPNVGKSSMVNRLLNERRAIVSDVPGTTRDSLQVDLDYQAEDGVAPWPFRLVDTAGLRARAKVNSPVEYFSGLRSHRAITGADVVFLLLDAMDGVTRQDKKLAGEILEGGACLIIVVNKWDLAVETFRREPLPGYKNLKDFERKFVDAVRKELFFLPESPVLFASAQEGIAIRETLETAREVYALSQQKLSTSQLNKVLSQLFERRPPRVVSGKRFKAYYGTQVGNRPLRIRLFCNAKEKLDAAYERYLESGLQSAFELSGCPVRLELVGKPKVDPKQRPWVGKGAARGEAAPSEAD